MALYGEESYGPVKRYGEQDFLGGETLGEFRRGKLGSFDYYYECEATGNVSKLEVEYPFSKRPVFTMALAQSEGAGFAVERLASAFYTRSGELVEASLLLIDYLFAMSQAGRIVLPEDVAESIRAMLTSGVHWMVTMRWIVDEKPVLIFNRTDIEETSVYELKFDQNASYYIPGTNWSLNLVHGGQRLGFALDSIEGANLNCWYSRFLSNEDLPSAKTVAGIKLEETVRLVFPEYELSTQKKSGKKVNGGS